MPVILYILAQKLVPLDFYLHVVVLQCFFFRLNPTYLWTKNKYTVEPRVNEPIDTDYSIHWKVSSQLL